MQRVCVCVCDWTFTGEAEHSKTCDIMFEDIKTKRKKMPRTESDHRMNAVTNNLLCTTFSINP